MQTAAEVVACGFQLFGFSHEQVGGNHTSVADDIQFTFVEDAGRNGAKNELLAAEDDGVAGIGASGETCYDIVARGEHIDDFSFTFVAENDAQEGVHFTLFHFTCLILFC